MQNFRPKFTLLLALLIGNIPMQASYHDFLQFAVSKQGHQNEDVLKMLYEQFFSSLSPTNKPILIALGGSPGSGKTTFRKTCLDTKNFHIHDMDEVMVLLPGYQKDQKTLGSKKAFENWWPCAREMAELLVQYAIQSRYCIIYDRTCGAEGSYFDLFHAKEQGYRISLIGFYVDQNIAKTRIFKREQEEGRAMTEMILMEYRSRFSALWPYYLQFVDEAILYQTDLETPHLLFSSKDGVQDDHEYQMFLDDGESFKSFFLKQLTITP